MSSAKLITWHVRAYLCRMFAIKTWFLEKHNFTYGSPKNNLFEVGHYTQMVWAASHKVGCGFARCPLKLEQQHRQTTTTTTVYDIHGRPRTTTHHHRTKHPKYFYNYVCNYCPMQVSILFASNNILISCTKYFISSIKQKEKFSTHWLAVRRPNVLRSKPNLHTSTNDASW
jgi:Cysteine-rich secretory protein family